MDGTCTVHLFGLTGVPKGERVRGGFARVPEGWELDSRALESLESCVRQGSTEFERVRKLGSRGLERISERGREGSRKGPKGLDRS